MDFRTACLLIKYLLLLDLASIRNILSVYLVRYSREPAYKPQLYPGSIIQNEVLKFPVYDDPDISIIIPVFNQWEATLSCLRSIHANTDAIAYEIIIADDGSTDETTNIHDHVANIRLIRNERNLQFLRNCNNAAQQANGKYLLLLNNDTNVQSGWLSHLLETASSDERIGIVGPKLVYPDGRLQEAGGIIWKDGAGWNYGRYDDPEKAEYNYEREVDYVSGACLLIRKELWEKVGGFDQRFAPAYYEDTDLAFQVRNLGCKVIYQPESVVVHFEGISSGTTVDAGIKRHQKLNRDKFVAKWETLLKKEHFERGSHLAEASDRGKPRS